MKRNKVVTLQDTGRGLFKLYFHNGHELGDIVAGDDGFYCFWPNLNGGFWQGYVLKEIAKVLDRLNKPLQKELEEYFKNEESKTARVSDQPESSDIQDL